eukprot:s3252_g19.t1
MRNSNLLAALLLWGLLAFSRREGLLFSPGWQSAQRPRFHKSRLNAAAGTSTLPAKQSILPAIREAAGEMGCLDEWMGSASSLAAACDMELEDAETLLAKGFGWSTWLAVNRAEYLKPDVPRPLEVAESLKWLASQPLNLNPTELRAVVQGSPKASLRNPAASFADSLTTAPEEFQQPAAFRELLVRCPIVLDLSFHCGFSCAAACSRCWCPAMQRIKKAVAKRQCYQVVAIGSQAAEDKQVIITALSGAVNIVRSNLSKFSEDGCPGTEPKRGNLLAIAPLAQALAMSLQAAGVPTSLESQDPALVRNILRTLMVAFEDCPTRFVESQHTSSELMPGSLHYV